MSVVSLAQMLFLALVLFLMGAACAMTRRNLIMILIGVEVMLNATGIALVAAAMRWQQMDGQVMVLFVMTVAAAEVAIGLALIVYVQRRTGSVNADRHNLLKG
jgi:NADH-quinone oxidoreductase subunit K